MITGFQYRSALLISKITVKELSSILGLHQITLLRYKKCPNLEYLACHSKNMLTIKQYFEGQGIIFPDKNSIKLSTGGMRSKDITRFHLITARIAAGLTQFQLSKLLEVSPGTISVLEQLNNMDIIESKKIKKHRLLRFLDHIGIELGDDYSVTLKKDPINFIRKSKMLVDTKL